MWTLNDEAGVTSQHMITVYLRVTVALGQVFFGARKARQTRSVLTRPMDSHVEATVICMGLSSLPSLCWLSRHRESHLCFYCPCEHIENQSVHTQRERTLVSLILPQASAKQQKLAVRRSGL